MKDAACSFTGHRIIAGEDKPYITARIRDALSKLADRGCKTFLCGGALGFDELVAIEVIRLKRTRDDVKLVLALPCIDWDRAWSERNKEIYRGIIKNADEVLYISEQYSAGCMHKRNRYLVDNSSLCIAYYDGRSGGTAYTVRYALSKEVKVINLKKFK